jgi:Ala-tRNA(Pro) deacylase
MALSKKLLAVLDREKIKHEILKHKKIYTAFDAAQTLKEDASNVAKSLLVKVDKKPVVVVVPAHYRVDLKKLKKLLKATSVEIVKEANIKKLLKATPGFLTAFGSMHHVDVVADKALLNAEKVIFSAGSFTESLRLRMKDYMKVEHPLTGAISTKVSGLGKAKKPKAAKTSKKTKTKKRA